MENLESLKAEILAAIAQAQDLKAWDEARVAALGKKGKVTELMKQRQYASLTVAEQSLVIFAAERGFLEDVEINKISAFEDALLNFARSKYADLLKAIDAKPDYNDEIVKNLTDLITDFKSTQTY